MLAVAASSGPAQPVQVFTCLCCQTHKCMANRCHRHRSCPTLMEGTTFPRTPNPPHLVFGGLQLFLSRLPAVVPADMSHFVLSAPAGRHKAVVLLDNGGNRKRYIRGITIRFPLPPCRAVLPPAGTRSAPHRSDRRAQRLPNTNAVSLAFGVTAVPPAEPQGFYLAFPRGLGHETHDGSERSAEPLRVFLLPLSARLTKRGAAARQNAVTEVAALPAPPHPQH